MKDSEQEVPRIAGPTPPTPPPLAPLLMMAFWMLLGGAAGIKLAQSVWQLLGWGAGEVSVAVPVGGGVGALAGAMLGLISNPRLLVLLMAVFAGASAGAVAGKLAWGAVGEIGGQVGGALVGGDSLGRVAIRRGQKGPPIVIPGGCSCLPCGSPFVAWLCRGSRPRGRSARPPGRRAS